MHLAVYDTLADWEVGHATAHINNGQWQRQPGRYRVATVGDHRAGHHDGRHAHHARRDAGRARPADSAMLVLPGADAWMTGANAAFAAKAGEFLDAGVPVAAICGATGGLAAAGAARRPPAHQQRR